MKYILCSDNITGHEKAQLNKIKNSLKPNSVEIVGIGPNTGQAAAKDKKNTNKIGLFIVGGIDGGFFMDWYDGIKKGYYHFKKIYILLVHDWCKSYMKHSLNYYKNNYQFKVIHKGNSRTTPYKENVWAGLTFKVWNKRYGDIVYANVVKDVNELVKIVTGTGSPRGIQN